MTSPRPIAVIGLGYVGLPLAVALARHFPTVGYDLDQDRIAELRTGHDRTGEIAARVMSDSPLTVTEDEDAIAAAESMVALAKAHDSKKQLHVFPKLAPAALC